MSDLAQRQLEPAHAIFATVAGCLPQARGPEGTTLAITYERSADAFVADFAYADRR